MTKKKSKQKKQNNSLKEYEKYNSFNYAPTKSSFENPFEKKEKQTEKQKEDVEEVLTKRLKDLIDYQSSFDYYLGAFVALGVVTLLTPLRNNIYLLATTLFLGIIMTSMGIILIKKTRRFRELKKKSGFKLGFY